MDIKILKNDISVALRGVCAIWIMLGHLGSTTKLVTLWIFWKTSLLIVGIFFFISGYGLMYGYLNKRNYMNRFLSKRLCKILIPVYFTYIYDGLLNLFINRDVNLRNIIEYIFLHDILHKTNWYIKELVIFYIVFYALYKFFLPNRANICLLVITVAGIIIGNKFGYGHAWIMSSICFPCGVYYMQHERKVNSIIEKYRMLTCIIMVLVCSMCYFFSLNNNIPLLISEGIFKNIACISLCILVLALLVKINIVNRFSLFLGKISYEIYLIHLIQINYLKTIFSDNKIIFCMTVIISSILLAWLLNLLICVVFKRKQMK